MNQPKSTKYKGYDIVQEGEREFMIMIDDVVVDDAGSLELAKEAITSRLDS